MSSLSLLGRAKRRWDRPLVGWRRVTSERGNLLPAREDAGDGQAHYAHRDKRPHRQRRRQPRKTEPPLDGADRDLQSRDVADRGKTRRGSDEANRNRRFGAADCCRQRSRRGQNWPVLPPQCPLTRGMPRMVS